MADLIQAKKIQVVDDKGIPLVSLEPTRGNEGGSIVLRDKSGDPKAWFNTGDGTARIGMISGAVDQPTATLGLSVSPDQTHIGLSSGRASMTSSVENEKPYFEIIGRDGKALFSAPWRK